MRFFSQNVCLLGTVRNVRPVQGEFEIVCRTGDPFTVSVDAQTSFQVLRNLAAENQDRVPEPKETFPTGSEATRLVNKYVKKGQMIAVQGLFQEHNPLVEGPTGQSMSAALLARRVHLLGSQPDQYNFELTQWWLSQLQTLADRWLDMLFGNKRDYEAGDFAEFYQTDWNISGLPENNDVQEMATLSRLIYGLASAYLLLGDDRYFRAAKAGVQYQRETFSSISHCGQYCFWAFGKERLKHNKTKMIVPSQNPDDVNSVPLYEQIYALSGLTQYYRITGDWDVLVDIRRTVKAFNDFYLDGLVGDDLEKKKAEEDGLWEFYKDFYGGYFSHIDYSTRDQNPALGDNLNRKNWNSIGDHIPAYLVNLLLALDPIPNGREDLEPFVEECRKMLVATSQLIVDRFPDENPEVPYVNERFHRDWSPDHQWRWQQNRAVVGHNLKIAWNLTRVANYFLYRADILKSRGDEEEAAHWRKLAEKNMGLADRLGRDMVDAGIDQVRGGCFDCVEREPTNGQPIQFAWGNTKDFWQQEQAILAYLILHGCTDDEEWRDKYLTLARECQAVWNLFFLDQDDVGVRFRITDTGDPVVEGSYAAKGGHSISGYHAFELNYLAHLYLRAYVAREAEAAFRVHFRPDERNRKQMSINVLPDFFRPEDVVLQAVYVNGVPRPDTVVRPDDFRVELREDELGSEVVAVFRTR